MQRSLGGALILVLAGCVNPLNPGREINLTVTDLVVPASVSPAGPIAIRMKVTSADCVGFERFEARRTRNQITLAARGVDHARPGILCTADIRVEPKTYEAGGPFADPLAVVVIQPDGNSVVRSVRVQ